MPNSTTWRPRHSALQSLLNALATATTPVYVVGGVIRDHLMNTPRATNDMDVVVEHSALQVARQVADELGWAYYPMDPERDVARLIFMASSPPLVCDVAAMRGGTIDRDLRTRDFTVNALAVKWERRAATQLVDVTGGLQDLEKKQLRRVAPSSLAEDPVRLLRAVRFAVQLGFTVEEETELQMLRMSDTVSLAGAERVRDELWKIMQLEGPEKAIDLLRRYGLLVYVLPEVAALGDVAQSPPHVLDVYRHTLQTVAFSRQICNWLRDEPQGSTTLRTPASRAWQAALGPWRFRLKQHFLQGMAADHLRLDWLVWHSLLHDVGKPQTRTWEAAEQGSGRYRFLGHDSAGAALVRARLEALRFSRQEVLLAEEVVTAHMRPHHLHASFGAEPISRRACYRFFRDAGRHSGKESGGRGFDVLPGVDVLLLAIADYQATYLAEVKSETMPPEWDGYLRHISELLEYAFHDDGLEQVRRPLVDGHTLMRYFNLRPGPEVGSLLERLHEAQGAGEIESADEALALAATWVLQKNNEGT